MRNYLMQMILLLPIVLTLIVGHMLPEGVDGAVVMVDDTMITYTPAEPLHSDVFNVTVEPVVIDAEPIEDGIVLMWSLCTEDGCGIAQPMVMNDNGDGTWSASIGPFPEKDTISGKDYEDILFRIKITASPTAGGDDIIEESESITVFFKTAPSEDDDTVDDDTTDDDNDDSPLGLAIVIAAMLLSAGYVAYRRKN